MKIGADFNMKSDVQPQIEKLKSVRGLEWVLHKQDPSVIAMFMNRLGISEVLASIISNRNIDKIDDAQAFMSPMLKSVMPDPKKLLDIDKAMQRVIRALNDEEKITVFADYDVDGATSSALLYKFFASIGETIDVYVPNRFSEGYGPSNGAFDNIKYNGTSLVIIVDCGSVAFEPLSYAKKIGIDVIVVDHHITETVLPEAVAILNPNRYDETFQPKTIAAVAVTFIFLVGLRAELRKNQWFSGDIQEPDMMDFLDVVALGTVCDLMPLIPLNRAFIKHGLKLIEKGSNHGITALMEVAKIRCKVQSHHLGYTIGPRINAGGRLDDSSLGFKLLTSNSKDEAVTIADTLEMLNTERKTLEALTLEDAINSVKNSNRSTDTVVIAIGSEWHVGVLGIIASRLKEEYHKPTFIMTLDEKKGIAKGSVRSIYGVDAAMLIQEAKDLSLILEGGGHAMAGGFSIAKDKIDEFSQYLQKRTTEITQNSKNLLSEARKIMVDAAISIQGVTPELFNEISKLEPFGLGNPKPYFMIDNVIIKNISYSKGICFITICDVFDQTQVLKCLCFITSSNNITDFLSQYSHNVIRVLGTLQANNMYAGYVNFVIDDICVYE
jgi:single-stranded-DNA-specific exonuclease